MGNCEHCDYNYISPESEPKPNENANAKEKAEAKHESESSSKHPVRQMPTVNKLTQKVKGSIETNLLKCKQCGSMMDLNNNVSYYPFQLFPHKYKANMNCSSLQTPGIDYHLSEPIQTGQLPHGRTSRIAGTPQILSIWNVDDHGMGRCDQTGRLDGELAYASLIWSYQTAASNGLGFEAP
ncbi:hypothetical protein PVAG01_06366 [Phlyctema vagabunda]|uniref:Uncharacterized protein n=1 Tax=Phlyctema vagabunda TaxID=108571 RepID=A0ABR4PG13_9HELO